MHTDPVRQTRLLDQNVRHRWWGYEALYLYETYTGHRLQVRVMRATIAAASDARALLLPEEETVQVLPVEEWVHLLPEECSRTDAVLDQLSEIALELLDRACGVLEARPANTG